MELNKPFKAPWLPFTLVLHDFKPDFRVMGGRFVSISSELRNPAARIVAYDQKGSVMGKAWAFPSDRAMLASHVSNLPVSFTYLSATPEYESGLQMSYDPGKSIVWIGCILFTLGLVITFYIACIEEWLIIYPDNRLLLAVNGNRSHDYLKEVLEKLEVEILESDEQEYS